jgi:dimeric dUTPase (all-alpha-NTP-PPase superfamily)
MFSFPPIRIYAVIDHEWHLPRASSQLPSREKLARFSGPGLFALRGQIPAQTKNFCLHHPSLLLYASRMERPDQLRELFRMRESLNERIGVKTDGLSGGEKTKWILNYPRAMTQEIAELTDRVPWKWRAKYQKVDEQNARAEAVDFFHFISMAQALGMSADDVFNAYCKKNEVNFKRQENGCAVKDEHDSRHI